MQINKWEILPLAIGDNGEFVEQEVWGKSQVLRFQEPLVADILSRVIKIIFSLGVNTEESLLKSQTNL